MKLPTPKAVMFDWDNTLVNTWPIIHAALELTFKAMGHTPWTLTETMQRVGKSMRDAFPDLFGERWEYAADLYQRYYREQQTDKLMALPDAEKVLMRVREKGLYSMVVSNKKGFNLRHEVEHMGWQRYFDKLVGAGDAKRDKPFADPALLALDKSGMAPAPDIWFIGDSEVDLACAENVGCTAILYGENARLHPEFSATHFRGYPYHAYAMDHAELLKLLG